LDLEKDMHLLKRKKMGLPESVRNVPIVQGGEDLLAVKQRKGGTKEQEPL